MSNWLNAALLNLISFTGTSNLDNILYSMAQDSGIVLSGQTVLRNSWDLNSTYILVVREVFHPHPSFVIFEHLKCALNFFETR